MEARGRRRYLDVALLGAQLDARPARRRSERATSTSSRPGRRDEPSRSTSAVERRLQADLEVGRAELDARRPSALIRIPRGTGSRLRVETARETKESLRGELVGCRRASFEVTAYHVFVLSWIIECVGWLRTRLRVASGLGCGCGVCGSCHSCDRPGAVAGAAGEAVRSSSRDLSTRRWGSEPARARPRPADRVEHGRVIAVEARGRSGQREVGRLTGQIHGELARTGVGGAAAPTGSRPARCRSTAQTACWISSIDRSAVALAGAASGASASGRSALGTSPA